MARLLLGPLIRAVEGSRVTVWVETDRPCEVTVAGHAARTVTLSGHHYGFVTVEGLGVAAPRGLGPAAPYTVALDGHRVWPDGHRFPPSLLRAPPHDRLTTVFGSCRSILSDERGDPDRVDALREYAWRAATAPAGTLPDVLVLLGDQVYSDKAAPATRRFIRRRRPVRGPLGLHTHDFPEYAALYREAWSEPAVRWLLSTVPSLMIFDDHEVIDNWNTSARWLAEYESQPWWRQRVTNALAAYWIYQHLGNLSPHERDADPGFAALVAGDESAALELLARRASRAGHGTQGAAWSYARDLGPARLVMVDARGGRVLAGGRRHLLDEATWAWLDQQVGHPAPYLLIGTSLPLLLPPGPHELERLTTAACAGRWGRAGAWLGERVRRSAQFNHWAAFPPSFARALDLVRAAATPPRRAVVALSGDVHYSYAARVRAWPDGEAPAVPVHQLVSSPLCYDLYRSIAGSFRAVVSPAGEVFGRLATRAAGAPRTDLRWTVDTGPWLRNVVSTLTLGGGGATARFECTRGDGRPGTRLETVAERRLL